MINQELVQRFLRNECNEDERNQVLNYFSAHPEKWNDYFDEEEWEDFQVTGQMPDLPAEEMFTKLTRRTKVRSINSRRLLVFASAASVLVFFIITMLWNYKNEKNSSNSVSQTNTNNSHEQLKTFMNTTGKMLAVSLQDGSTVQLAPKSVIQYYEPFVTKNRRIIYLSGEALFKVSKDKHHPFTVYSGDISTTALGTSFTVKAFSETDYINVALHEGKVIIQSADSVHRKLAKDELLMPGDEFRYNRKTGVATVSHMAAGDRLVKASPKKNNLPGAAKPDWYKFSGQPLAEVFEQLSQYYGVDIYDYPSQLSNKYLTGKIEKTDSLHSILKDIALLNELIIKKENGTYIITKKVH
jgi:transmembrane sensor